MQPLRKHAFSDFWHLLRRMPEHQTGAAVHGWLIFCAAVTPLIWLVLLPTARRRRDLLRRGRTTTAVCREHLAPDHSNGYPRVGCTFRPDPERGEYHVIVQTPEHVPQVGEELWIVYDPKNPRRAESQDATAISGFYYVDVLVPLIWFVGNVLILGFASVMTGPDS